MYYSVHQSFFCVLFQLFFVFAWHHHHEAEMGRAGCGGKRTERLHQMRHVIIFHPVNTLSACVASHPRNAPPEPHPITIRSWSYSPELVVDDGGRGGNLGRDGGGVEIAVAGGAAADGRPVVTMESMESEG